MTTLAVEPLAQELNAISPSIAQFPRENAEHPLVLGRTPNTSVSQTDPNPLLVVFIACVIAFHLASAMIGIVMAWVYQLRHSGAFAP